MLTSTVENVDQERLAPFRSLREQSPTLAPRTVVIDGIQQVEQLLTQGYPVERLLVDPLAHTRLGSQISAITYQHTECIIAPKSFMDELVGYKLHRGVMALVPLPNPATLEELQWPILALDDLVDAENVGGIVRTAAAFGLTSFVAAGSCASPWSRRAVRVSMATALHLRLCPVTQLADALERLRTLGGTIYALEQAATARPISGSHFPEKSVLVLGNERNGISHSTLAAVDDIIEIPLATHRSVHSLNVTAAAAIALYHLAGPGI